MRIRFTYLTAALVLAAWSASAAAQSAQSPPPQNTPMQQMGNMPMQNMPGMKGMQASPGEAQGVGVVEAIDPQKGTVTLKHQAIKSIHWPAMTMTFRVASPAVLQGVKSGEHVRFGLHPAGMKSTVTWIRPVSP